MAFSTLHATTTVILVGLMYYPRTPPVEILYIAVVSAVFIDVDIIFASDHHRHGHRDLITHSMLPWLILLIASFWVQIVFWVAVPILLHLSLDAIDGGIMPLAPLTRWRTREVEVADDEGYTSRYWKSNKVIISEILTALLVIIISSNWKGDIMISLVKWCAWVTIGFVIICTIYFRRR